MQRWSRTVFSAYTLVFVQVVISHAKNMCVTVDGRCGSQEVMNPSCHDENDDDIFIPVFSSGSGNNDHLPHCYTMDDALLEMRSNDTLFLSRGTHVLGSVTASSGANELSGISIVGNPSNHDEVVVTCKHGVGLSFVNMSGLSLSGFTLQGCSLDGSHTIANMNISNKQFSYPVIFDLVGALFLIHCSDVLVENVTIQNNLGLGLVGWNLLGDTQFSGVNLLANSPHACEFDLEGHHEASPGEYIGGGALILYQDYEEANVRKVSEHSLTFDNGTVADNYGCQRGISTFLFNKLFTRVADSDLYEYSEGAGGVSIIFGQSNYYVNVTIDSYTFRNNTNLFGAGGMMLLLYELSNKSDIYITNSVFVDNGGALENRDTSKEGALLIMFYVPDSSSTFGKDSLLKYLHQLPSKVHILNTMFMNNSAVLGGGMCVLSFGPLQSFVRNQLTLENCTFQSNQAEHGSAIYATEINYRSYENGLEMSLHDVRISRNRGELEAVSFSQLKVSFSGTTTFARNKVTALSLYKSTVEFSGEATFVRNTANRGGAVHLTRAESYIFVKNNTNVTFIANEGRIAGGAIFVELNVNSPTSYDCVLFVEEIALLCHEFSDCSANGSSVHFTNNSAPVGGAIFGSALYNCPWSNGIHFIDVDSRSPHDIAEDIVASLHSAKSWLHFDPSVELGNFVIGTLPEFIVPDTEGHDFNLRFNFNVTPGGQITLNLAAFDQLFQPIPLTILSRIVKLRKDRRAARSSIGESNRYLLFGADSYTEVPIHIFGQIGETYNLSINSIETPAEFEVSVTMTNCSKGFQFNDDPESPRCECEVNHTLVEVTCNDDGTITHPYGHWTGTSEGGEYILHRCIQNYCQLKVTDVDLDFPDKQCADNRAGVLCGGCLPTCSRVLGSTRCLTCPNDHPLAFIALFAVLGLLLVGFIKIFNFTVTDGYINGFIFYSNIVTLYFHRLSVDQIQSMDPLFPVISFMNLNFGVETCFYNGMTELDLAGLTLVFPVYLLSILLVIVVFTEYLSPHARKILKAISLGRKRKTSTANDHDNHTTVRSRTVSGCNLTKLLVTLLLISYTSIIQICFNLLRYVQIETPSGQIVSWGNDPNQKYFSGIHIPLFFIAIGLLLVLVPIPFVLLYPKMILRWRITNKPLKPIIDATAAPFKEEYQFWLGFRLLCRLFIYLFITHGPGSYRSVVLAVILFLVLVLEALIQPFKTTGRNFVDLSLMVNLTLLAILAIYFEPSGRLNTVLVTFTSVFVIELLLLTCYYIVIRFTFTKKLYDSLIDEIRSFVKRGVARVNCKSTKRGKGSDRDLQVQNRAARRTLRRNPTINHWSIRFGSSVSNQSNEAPYVLRETLLEETHL